MESLMPSIIQDHSVGPGVYSLPPLIPEGPSYSFAQAGRFFTPTNQVKISFSSITPEKYREGSRPSHRSPDLKNKSKSVPNDLFFKRALFEISESPGPGQYNLPSTLYNKDFQLKGKFKEPKGQDTPGPGTYNSDLQEKKGFALLKDSRLKPEISPTANVDFCLPKLRNGSPSYSFGKRAKSPKISDIPGPGSYNLPSVSEPAKITIANRIKSPEPLKTPGPGTYTVSASKNSQEFSLGLPLKSQIHLSPGPGDYDVEHKNPGPFYSFGTKSELKQELDNRDFSDLPSTFDGKAAVLIGKPKIDHSNCSPGPGAYNPQLLRTNLMFSQSKSPREGKIQMSPGPGDYESPLKPIGPFYSLGHKIHSSEPEVSPGPGHYDLSRTERIKSPLLRGKPKNENPSKVPGPGAYYPNKTFTCIAYTNGNDSRFKDIEKTPGPGDFHSELKVQGPKFSFTGREKSSFEVKSDTPGPGSYMLPSTISKLAAKICGKRTEEKPNDVPGPGAYINNELDMPRNKGFSMGKGERHDSSSFSKNIPGPGTYESERAKSVGYSFGKDLRSSELHDDVPGPGSYDWKAIDNSKKFTMTGKEVRKDSSLAPVRFI